ncbi:Conserved putative membrane protein [Estrella lausannensis]|uniref:Conserved putative membrane protein n=2 Tax=Estrella lausannensis TaxID=483423 RepID=A0A0H5E657_9BACT|nr:Conserved putative membrane protein [Estrella lausannensis]
MKIVILFFVLLILILWIWFSVILWSLRNGISPMPTTDKARKKVLSSIPHETQGVVVDLGSGWGNMVTQLAKLLPHCQVVGYETSPIPFFLSKCWKKFERLSNLQLKRMNFFEASLKDVSLVYCYLYPAAMERLKKKFEEELKPGTVVISNTFAVPGWEPVQILQLADIYHTRIYVYVKNNSNVAALHAKAEDEEIKIPLTMAKK